MASYVSRFYTFNFWLRGYFKLLVYRCSPSNLSELNNTISWQVSCVHPVQTSCTLSLLNFWFACNVLSPVAELIQLWLFFWEGGHFVSYWRIFWLLSLVPPIGYSFELYFFLPWNSHSIPMPCWGVESRNHVANRLSYFVHFYRLYFFTVAMEFLPIRCIVL